MAYKSHIGNGGIGFPVRQAAYLSRNAGTKSYRLHSFPHALQRAFGTALDHYPVALRKDRTISARLLAVVVAAARSSSQDMQQGGPNKIQASPHVIARRPSGSTFISGLLRTYAHLLEAGGLVIE